MGELTQQQRTALADHIAVERDRRLALAAALERQFDNIVTASADAVRDDEHDPEGATIAFERAQVAALLADTRDQVAALEAAAARLTDDDPGRCRLCHAPIGYERLLARPTATRCVRCAAS